MGFERAFRWSISAVFTFWLFAPNAQAQSAATAINGVYNGSYTCAIGPRTLKLSLLASGTGSLTAVFTFYLPPTSHTQAFSYSLSGTFDAASGKFKLNPVKWEVPPPESYAMVGMEGAFDPGTGQVAGKITYGSCGTFRAKRDRAASANIASVIAPQKAAGAAQPVPKTVARVASTAPPSKATVADSPPTTTKGIVHESKAYWGAYRTDIIRQVFEGDFGRHVDSSTQFRILFNSYVESFSKSCHAYLPAQHEAVTLSQATTKKDSHGKVISQQQGQPWTVDVDSRFAPEYREYADSLLTTSGETLAGALAIASGRVSASAYFDPGTDITTFFTKETCGSAAMHQLTENLLRAAKGKSPLQDAGDPNIVRVCVPANLVENHSWNNPPPGGKMEKFKNAVRKIVREEVRSKGLENPLFWVVERPAGGSADLFDNFDPATTDPRRLVQFGGAGRDAHCTVGSYALTLPINP